jgi:beta-lactamase class A
MMGVWIFLRHLSFFVARADAALPLVDAAIAECARLAVTDLRSGRL